jgi:hypothetical protein
MVTVLVRPVKLKLPRDGHGCLHGRGMFSNCAIRLFDRPDPGVSALRARQDLDCPTEVRNRDPESEQFLQGATR